MEQRFFVGRHESSEVCMNSSSGGIFTAITDEWFHQYGDEAVVYGCILDEKLTARHVRAINADQRDAMRGSKYVGSDMSSVLRSAVDDLRGGLRLLFRVHLVRLLPLSAWQIACMCPLIVCSQ